MRPLLFTIGSIEIPSYHFLITLGFLVCIPVGIALARREGIKEVNILDICLYLDLVAMSPN